MGNDSIEYVPGRTSTASTEKSGERGRKHYPGWECSDTAKAVLFRAKENGINQNVLLNALVLMWGKDNLPELARVKSIDSINLKTVVSHISLEKHLSDMKKWYSDAMSAIE